MRHSLFVAILASALDKSLSLGFAGEEFTAGIMHDIGRIIVCGKIPEQFLRFDPLTFEESSDLLAREQLILGIDHCRIGALFATKNNFSLSTTRAILNHHHPEKEEDCPKLVALIACADDLANHIQNDRNISKFDLRNSRGFEILSTDWSKEVIDRLEATLGSIVIYAIRETRSSLKAFDLR